MRERDELIVVERGRSATDNPSGDAGAHDISAYDDIAPALQIELRAKHRIYFAPLRISRFPALELREIGVYALRHRQFVARSALRRRHPSALLAPEQECGSIERLGRGLVILDP